MDKEKRPRYGSGSYSVVLGAHVTLRDMWSKCLHTAVNLTSGQRDSSTVFEGESLNDYAKSLSDALKANKKHYTYNKDMRHAAVVVCTAFEHAKDEIMLLSNKLDRALYASPWFVDAIDAFIKKGGKLRVVVETDIEAAHPVISRAKTPNVEIRRVPPDFFEHYTFNFMVVDDIGYRFESDRESQEALVCFNSDEHVGFLKALKAIFEDLWGRSTAIA